MKIVDGGISNVLGTSADFVFILTSINTACLAMFFLLLCPGISSDPNALSEEFF